VIFVLTFVILLVFILARAYFLLDEETNRIVEVRVRMAQRKGCGALGGCGFRVARRRDLKTNRYEIGKDWHPSPH
jgi:hypothetical protein